MSEDVVQRDELAATIQARKELGAEMEPALIDAYVERIERRIEQRLAERAGESDWALQQRRDHQKEMVLGSMGISVPLLLIAAIFTGLAGVIAVCVALAVIAIVTTR